MPWYLPSPSQPISSALPGPTLSVTTTPAVNIVPREHHTASRAHHILMRHLATLSVGVGSCVSYYFSTGKDTVAFRVIISGTLF